MWWGINTVLLESSTLNTLLIVLLCVGVATLAIGLWLVASPESFSRFGERMNSWVSADSLVRKLDYPHAIERFMYRNHRWVGLSILAATLFVLFSMLFRFDRDKAITVFADGTNVQMVEWLVDSLSVILVLATVFALVIGVFMIIRPSLLKGFEAWSNHWVSTRRGTRFLDVMRYESTDGLMRYPRVTGALVVVGSLYVVLSCLMYLL
jgi:hypothetical protein